MQYQVISLLLLIIGIVCCLVMKKIRPEWCRPYIVYVLIIEIIINSFLLTYAFLKIMR